MSTRNVSCVVIGAAVAALSIASAVQAEAIITPVAGYQTVGRNWSDASSLFNGNANVGATGNLTSALTTGDAIPAVWPSQFDDPTNFGEDSNGGKCWWAENKLPGNQCAVLFDLGQAYDLTGVHIWNYNRQNWASRGFPDVSVYTFTDAQATAIIAAGGALINTDNGGNITAANFDTGGTLLVSNATLALANSTGIGDTGQTIALNAASVRYVAIRGGSDLTQNDFRALDEVRFMGTSVPEPTTLGVIGLGAIALMGRKRAR